MFKNRREAGEQLGEALLSYKNEHPLVLAIPRGGVEIAYYVAEALKCDFEVVIVRKLGHPYEPEAAFGAMAEDKSLYLSPWSHKHLNREIIQDVMLREGKEIQRRVETYREGRPLPDMEGRTVVLVDDGIATGSTLFAAIELCVKRKAGKIVVAAPVASLEMYDEFEQHVDEVVILEVLPELFAVSQAYDTFSNLNDRQVMHFLRQKSRSFS